MTEQQHELTPTTDRPLFLTPPGKVAFCPYCGGPAARVRGSLRCEACRVCFHVSFGYRLRKPVGGRKKVQE